MWKTQSPTFAGITDLFRNSSGLLRRECSFDTTYVVNGDEATEAERRLAVDNRQYLHWENYYEAGGMPL